MRSTSKRGSRKATREKKNGLQRTDESSNVAKSCDEPMVWENNLRVKKRRKTFHHDLWSPANRKKYRNDERSSIDFFFDWISEDPHQSRKIMIRNALWNEVDWKTSISLLDGLFQVFWTWSQHILSFTSLGSRLMCFQRISDGTKRTREQ